MSARLTTSHSSLTDYDAVIDRLELGGVRAVKLAGPGRPRQVFIEDPNGVRIEISVRAID